MNRNALITLGRKMNGDTLYLLSVLDVEPSGVIIHAYNQIDSKEYMLPISEIEVCDKRLFIFYYYVNKLRISPSW